MSNAAHDTSDRPSAPFGDELQMTFIPEDRGNVRSITGHKLDKLDVAFFANTGEDWVDAPNPGATRFAAPFHPAGIGIGLAGKGKVGKTVNEADLFGKMAWPLPGDTWMGQPLPPEGGRVMFITREENRERMVRLSHMLGWPERRRQYQEMHGTEMRFMLKHQLEVQSLVMQDGNSVKPTKYMQTMRDFGRDWRPALAFLDTGSKLISADQNNRTQMSAAMDIVCDFAADTGAAAVMSLHTNKGSETKNLDALRDAISGSGGIIDGLRLTLGMAHAGRDLAQAVIDAGLAEFHREVFILGGWGNVTELDHLSHQPLIFRRGKTMRDGYEDVTERFRAKNPHFDLLVEGIKPPKAVADDRTPKPAARRGRKPKEA